MGTFVYFTEEQKRQVNDVDLEAYLLQRRHIDWAVLIEFVRARLLYEDADRHNVVFVDRDENGTAKHAHMRSTNSWGDPFRLCGTPPT